MATMSELLTVADAARLANVSARTMRRRILRGQVATVGQGPARLVVSASLFEHVSASGQAGHEQVSEAGQVTVTADTTMTASGQADTVTANGHEAVQLAELVRELTARVADLSAAATLWQERARVLGEQLAIAAPPQPVDASGSTDTRPTPGSPFTRVVRSPGVVAVTLVTLVTLVLLATVVLR